MAITLELPIIGRNLIADRTAEVLFGLKGARFSFLAGQYVRITIINSHYEDARGNSRDFSIASSPDEKRYLKIACRISESGFKKNLLEIPIGTKVKIEGPFGVFTLSKGYSRPIVFVAGGIGITPFLSMAAFAAEEKLPYKMTLLYANGRKESAAYLNVLKEMEARNPNFRLRDKIGPLDDVFISQNAAECFRPGASCLWYIAGPAGMAYEARQVLIRRGVNEKDIQTEEFSGYGEEKNRI